MPKTLLQILQTQPKITYTTPNPQGSGMTPYRNEKAIQAFLKTLRVRKDDLSVQPDGVFDGSTVKAFNLKANRFGNDRVDFNNLKSGRPLQQSDFTVPSRPGQDTDAAQYRSGDKLSGSDINTSEAPVYRTGAGADEEVVYAAFKEFLEITQIDPEEAWEIFAEANQLDEVGDTMMGRFKLRSTLNRATKRLSRDQNSSKQRNVIANVKGRLNKNYASVGHPEDPARPGESKKLFAKRSDYYKHGKFWDGKEEIELESNQSPAEFSKAPANDSAKSSTFTATSGGAYKGGSVPTMTMQKILRTDVRAKQESGKFKIPEARSLRDIVPLVDGKSWKFGDDDDSDTKKKASKAIRMQKQKRQVVDETRVCVDVDNDKDSETKDKKDAVSVDKKEKKDLKATDTGKKKKKFNFKNLKKGKE